MNSVARPSSGHFLLHIIAVAALSCFCVRANAQASGYCGADFTSITAGWTMSATLTDSGGDDDFGVDLHGSVSVEAGSKPEIKSGWTTWDVTFSPPVSPPNLSFHVDLYGNADVSNIVEAAEGRARADWSIGGFNFSGTADANAPTATGLSDSKTNGATINSGTAEFDLTISLYDYASLTG
jgi:hypothetical protein